MIDITLNEADQEGFQTLLINTSSYVSKLSGTFLRSSASIQSLTGSLTITNGGLLLTGTLINDFTSLRIQSNTFRQFYVAGVGSAQTAVLFDDVTGNGAFLNFTTNGGNPSFSMGKRFDGHFVAFDGQIGANNNQAIFDYQNLGSSGSWTFFNNAFFNVTGPATFSGTATIAGLTVNGPIIGGDASTLLLNSPTTNGQIPIRFYDNGNYKFALYKATDNTFRMFDNQNGKDAYNYNPSTNNFIHSSNVVVTGSISSNTFAAIPGLRMAQGSAGTGFPGNVINIYWTGSSAQLWVDTTNVGTITVSSDRRIKKNIVTASGNILDLLDKIRVVNYNWIDGGIFKDDGILHLGFIADELQQIIPSSVTGDPNAVNEDGSIAPQTLNTIEIVAFLVQSIQTLRQQVLSLQSGSVA